MSIFAFSSSYDCFKFIVFLFILYLRDIFTRLHKDFFCFFNFHSLIQIFNTFYPGRIEILLSFFNFVIYYFFLFYEDYLYNFHKIFARNLYLIDRSKNHIISFFLKLNIWGILNLKKMILSLI